MKNFFEALYIFLWKDFLCRLEPFTYEFRRHVARWARIDLILAGISAGLIVWMLIFPLSYIPTWLRILIVIIGVCSFTFYSWLLLHLGNYALKALNKIRRK